MNAQLVKILAGVAVVLALLGWGFYERSGKVSAEKELELTQERVRETNRAVTALGTATTAANARADALAARRREENAPLIAQIQKLELRVGNKPSGKDCREAFNEWRNGQ